MTCTPGHPVCVEGKGWVEAGDLVAGNAIVTRTGTPLTVASLGWQRDETGNHPFTVYNLTVEDDHTYFAGDIGGGLWVHNCLLDYLKGSRGRWCTQTTRYQLDNLATQAEDEGGTVFGIIASNSGSVVTAECVGIRLRSVVPWRLTSVSRTQSP